jgi:hypothetical protein
VPAIIIDEGIRAIRGIKPIDPDGVWRYLEDKFGDDLAWCGRQCNGSPRAFNPRNWLTGLSGCTNDSGPQSPKA